MSAGSYLFTFEAEPSFPRPRPGQFVNVLTSEDLALRRPFSVAGIPEDGAFELLVELRGKGTHDLAAFPVGSIVSVVGPLGNEFTTPSGEGASIIVAGGIGVAGVRLLAQHLRGSSRRLRLLVGARSADGLLHHLLPPPSGDGEVLVEVSTDDGSSGFQGTVCELLESVLDGGPRPAVVYCCGPPAMIRSAAPVALARDIPCEVLLEEMMACGVGACRGCVVETRDGYRAVCADGPVFDARELLLSEPSLTQ